MVIFADRLEAGRILGQALRHYTGQLENLVLGVPRGGVIVAAEVAKIIGGQLDIIIPRKIGAPHNPEVAVGALAPDGTTILHHELLSLLGLHERDLAPIIQDELAEIKRRLAVYRGEALPLQVDGKNVLLVDDGIATGFTLQAALRSIKRHSPRRLVLAVPVAPQDSLERLKLEVDDLVCLLVSEDFIAVGQFYRDFSQTTDEEVIKLLKNNWK